MMIWTRRHQIPEDRPQRQEHGSVLDKAFAGSLLINATRIFVFLDTYRYPASRDDEIK
jgi:hypothetical protein